MLDAPRRKATWPLAGAAAAAVALFFARGERREPAPAASEAPTSAVEAKAIAPAAPAPLAPGDAGPAGGPPLARAMPPPDAIDAEAENPEIEPELPKTPEWRMGKTRTILRAVERRATRVQGEIAALDAGGRGAEAEERRVLLGRLTRQAAKMKADIASYAAQIAAEGAPAAEENTAPEGGPP